MLPQEAEFDLNDFRNERAAAINTETEVQNLLRARVGGWLEWVVGWMDFRDDDNDDNDNDYEIHEHLNVGLKIRESTPIKVKINPISTFSERKLDIEDQDGDKIKSEHTDNPPLAPAYSLVSSSIETGIEVEAKTKAEIEARTANWAGVHDIWWGDAKWLLGVAGKVAW